MNAKFNCYKEHCKLELLSRAILNKLIGVFLKLAKILYNEADDVQLKLHVYLKSI